jgi:hypothetical protein
MAHAGGMREEGGPNKAQRRRRNLYLSEINPYLDVKEKRDGLEIWTVRP